MSNPKKWRCVYRMLDDDNFKPREIRGRIAQTLAALVAAGARGITAAEMGTWAYRLSAYIHILKHEYRLDIVTRREEHEGGWHGRYELLSAVEITELDGPEET